MTKYRKYYIPFLIFIFFMIDQFTKEVVIRNLKVGYSIPESGFFRFTHVRNFGSAFSIINDANLFLMIVGIFAIIFISYFATTDSKKRGFMARSKNNFYYRDHYNLTKVEVERSSTIVVYNFKLNNILI